MPEQPADPIHYDTKIPPEPKHGEEQQDEKKEHGDKIDTGAKSDKRDAEGKNKGGEK